MLLTKFTCLLVGTLTKCEPVNECNTFLGYDHTLRSSGPLQSATPQGFPGLSLMHCRNYSWGDAKSRQTLAISLWQTYMITIGLTIGFKSIQQTWRIRWLVWWLLNIPVLSITSTNIHPEWPWKQFIPIPRNWVPSIWFGGMGIAFVKTNQLRLQKWAACRSPQPQRMLQSSSEHGLLKCVIEKIYRTSEPQDGRSALDNPAFYKKKN